MNSYILNKRLARLEQHIRILEDTIKILEKYLIKSIKKDSKTAIGEISNEMHGKG